MLSGIGTAQNQEGGAVLELWSRCWVWQQAGGQGAARQCWGQGTADSSNSSRGQPAGVISQDRLLVGFNSTNSLKKLEEAKGKDYSLLASDTLNLQC